MSIGLALQTALSGLQANQTKSAILSRNIANATVAGYTRKDAVLSSLAIGGEGRGVYVSAYTRNASAELALEARTQASSHASVAARASILATYTQSIGQPQEERSIGSAIGRLEQAFLSLEDLPESPTQQRAVVNAAQDLASRLNSAEAAITTARSDADRQINDAVTDINSTLKRLQELNRQVAVRTGSGQDTTELQDERDRLLDGLSEKIGIHYFSREGNQLVVMTKGGVTLLDDTAHLLTFNATAIVGPGATYPGGLSGITVDGNDIAPGSGYPLPIKGGSLEGLFAVRDQIMPEMQKQVDEIARTLIEQFQAAETNPGAGLFVGNTATAGIAGSLRVNPAVVLPTGDPSLVRIGINGDPATPAGDTTQIKKFLAIFSAQVSFDPSAGLMVTGTIKDFTNSAISQQHSIRATAQAEAKTLDIQMETVKATREGREGVNIDEELQELMVLERSYAANAQIMQAATRMLDKLLEI